MEERDEEGKESSRERSEGTSENKEMKGGGGDGWEKVRVKTWKDEGRGG